MKRDILFLCQFFYPESNSSATLPFDTARALAAEGYSVSALCGYPKEYNFSGAASGREEKDGVSIRRLRYIQTGRKGKLGRLVNYFSFTLSVLLHLHILRKFRLILVYSNPPILPMIAVLANKLFGTKLVFVCYDAYPEVAYASGHLRAGSAVSRFMDRVNRGVFRRAAAVVALTEEMRDFLLDHRPGLSPERAAVISNWAHEDHHENDRLNARSRLGIPQESFVVAYFGNIGVCQNVETILEAMELLKDEKDVVFLFAGHGNKMDQVRAAAVSNPGIIVKGFLTGDSFGDVLSASDCGIVSLEKGLGGMVAPSKYYSYLQSGLPVLAVTERSCYIARELQEAEHGIWVNVGEGRGLANAVLELKGDPAWLQAMSEHARRLYQTSYAKQIGLAKYADLIKRCI